MAPGENPGPTASSMLQELDALRQRLDQASHWFSGPEASLHAAALAEEVKRLCHEGSLCEDAVEAESLLAAASQHLEELQKLLGVH